MGHPGAIGLHATSHHDDPRLKLDPVTYPEPSVCQMEDMILFETVRDGSREVCVCTDDLARGINITTLQTVVNYDLTAGGANALRDLSARDLGLGAARGKGDKGGKGGKSGKGGGGDGGGGGGRGGGGGEANLDLYLHRTGRATRRPDKVVSLLQFHNQFALFRAN